MISIGDFKPVKKDEVFLVQLIQKNFEVKKYWINFQVTDIFYEHENMEKEIQKYKRTL